VGSIALILKRGPENLERFYSLEEARAKPWDEGCAQVPLLVELGGPCRRRRVQFGKDVLSETYDYRPGTLAHIIQQNRFCVEPLAFRAWHNHWLTFATPLPEFGPL